MKQWTTLHQGEWVNGTLFNPRPHFFWCGKILGRKLHSILLLSCKLVGLIACLCAVSGVSVGGGRDDSLPPGAEAVLYDRMTVNVIFGAKCSKFTILSTYFPHWTREFHSYHWRIYIEPQIVEWKVTSRNNSLAANHHQGAITSVWVMKLQVVLGVLGTEKLRPLILNPSDITGSACFCSLLPGCRGAGWETREGWRHRRSIRTSHRRSSAELAEH